MPRLMFDSVTAADIPGSALMVAGYADGLYRWSDEDWALHSNAVHVRIAAASLDLSAHVADIETGALTAADGASFVKQKLARGEHPTLYFSASKLREVQAALSAAGLDPYHGYSIWVADWNGQNAAYAYGVAHQYANPAITGGHFDLSWVADYWEGVDPAPVVAPPPPPPTPPAGPPPVPPPTPTVDAARAAWARLGDLLIHDFPGTVDRIAAAVTKINNLP